LRDIAKTPDGQRIFVGYESQRSQPRTLEPAREQHAQGLMRKSSFERIAHEIMSVRARESLDEQLPRLWQQGTPLLCFQPLANLIRQLSPLSRFGN
jgi:hypothetical protein